MQIDRGPVTKPVSRRAFCVLECAGCEGLCMAVYMMLTRAEQDEMCRRYRDGQQARLN